MYEPGFFALRMPWLAPLMRNVNAGPLFVALGMLPLENELSSRPLRSIALALRARARRSSARARISRGCAGGAPAGRARRSRIFSHRRTSRPARRACGSRTCSSRTGASSMTALRAGVDEDIARIAGVVSRGATFFVTPEGFYSTDGRMRPLKGIVEHLAPIASVRFAAIAFDPFRGRRLSMLYRIVEPADPRDLATSLAAARPVTTSALLAQWLLAVESAVRAQRSARRRRAPARRAPARRVRRSRAARRSGPVRGRSARSAARARDRSSRDGGRYRLAATRRDARFPGVADIVATKRAFTRRRSPRCRSRADARQRTVIGTARTASTPSTLRAMICSV